MTTNSPNPVDGDVQALIADCEREIAELEKALTTWGDAWIPYLQSKLKRQQVALAALTAEPVAQTSDIFMRELKINKSVHCWLVPPDSDPGFTVRLYTIPPAQLLRPVEPVHQVKIDDVWVDLSEGAMKSQLRHGATARTLYAHPSGQVDLSNLQHKDDSWVHIGDVKKSLRQQGYEVKS